MKDAQNCLNFYLEYARKPLSTVYNFLNTKSWEHQLTSWKIEFGGNRNTIVFLSQPV